jgi:hypothetical protein
MLIVLMFRAHGPSSTSPSIHESFPSLNLTPTQTANKTKCNESVFFMIMKRKKLIDLTYVSIQFLFELLFVITQFFESFQSIISL